MHCHIFTFDFVGSGDGVICVVELETGNTMMEKKPQTWRINGKNKTVNSKIGFKKRKSTLLRARTRTNDELNTTYDSEWEIWTGSTNVLITIGHPRSINEPSKPYEISWFLSTVTPIFSLIQEIDWSFYGRLFYFVIRTLGISSFHVNGEDCIVTGCEDRSFKILDMKTGTLLMFLFVCLFVCLFHFPFLLKPQGPTYCVPSVLGSRSRPWQHSQLSPMLLFNACCAIDSISYAFNSTILQNYLNPVFLFFFFTFASLFHFRLVSQPYCLFLQTSALKKTRKPYSIS